MTTSAPRPPRHARRPVTALAGILALGAAGALVVPATPSSAVENAISATGRVSVTTSGAQRDHEIGGVVALAQQGRFVAFSSTAALVAGDTNGEHDVYLRDRLGGTTTRVSLTDADTQIGGPSQLCAMSRNARFVAFIGQGSGLTVPGSSQIYVRDRVERETSIVSTSSDGLPSTLGDGTSGVWGGEECAVSDDGRYVAFQSEDGDLAPGASHDGDVYRRDLKNGTTQLVNVAAVGGAVPNGSTYDVAMSGDGSVVAFTSEANNLVAADTNGDADVFFRSFVTNTTHRISVKTGGAQIEGGGFDPSITGNGLKVAFTSGGTDVVAGDTNGTDDVFVRDRQAATTARVSLSGSGNQLAHPAGNGDISDAGTVVTFSLDVPTPTVDDANLDDDVFRRDVTTGELDLVSVAKSTATGNEGTWQHALSNDGMVVAFVSAASDLVRNDTNGDEDAFVRDFAVETTPFGNVEGFVHQQFVDFVGRAPTPAEGSAWEERLFNGEIVPEQMIDELAHAPAWAGKRGPVARLYWAFFLRVPDKAGMDYWLGEATKGLSLPKMASKFAASQEFKTKYGPLSNSAFVSEIYENVFDRAPDAAGLAYWKDQLDTGKKTRGDVMVGFSESAEGKLLLAPAVDSVLVWLGMMRTVPPSSWSIGGIAEGYAAGEPPEILPRAVLALPAYADRVS